MLTYRSRLFAVLALSCVVNAASAAITAEGLVLVVNKQQPAGRELAERYAQLRGVPAGRIIEVDVPDHVEIDVERYDSAIAGVVRAEIASRQLREKVQCIVLFYGLPLRIRERDRTPAERLEVSKVIDPAIAALRGQMKQSVEQVEALAVELDPTFKPSPTLEATEQMRQRGVAAEKAVEARIALLEGFDQVHALGKLRSARALLTKMPPLAADVVAKPATLPTQQQVNEWLAKPDDAAARRSLREALYSGGNLFQLLMLLEGQKRTLVANETESSVDSELSCLWLQSYPRAKWLPNPFHHAATAQAAELEKGMVRVARIDGPTPEIARRSIENAAKVEQEGLRGDVVLDARGLSGNGGPGSYESCDQSIRNATKWLTGAADLPAVFDNNPPLLPPGSSTRAAAYCGWYSVRKYAPSAKFVPGAVAWHVASYELVALRPPGEQGWCRGLMMDGADVTLGPVGEPYLVAFPPADEFFGLLLTGRASVADAYWATTPVASWKMILIGDPLYRPFAKNPTVKVEELPPALQKAVAEK